MASNCKPLKTLCKSGCHKTFETFAQIHSARFQVTRYLETAAGQRDERLEIHFCRDPVMSNAIWTRIESY